VLANDISVMQSSKESKLTLVTCWPVGTSLKRLAVTAKQIFPNPNKNTNPENILNFEQLPAGR
jgi:LPXTG-site transpeptidase (sortase) family protein